MQMCTCYHPGFLLRLAGLHDCRRVLLQLWEQAMRKNEPGCWQGWPAARAAGLPWPCR